TVDLHVADCACLVLNGLIMERGSTRSRKVHRCRMALQAKRIAFVASQQTRLRRPVGKVTRRATLDLERRMLVHKRAGGFGMTFCADSVLVGAGLKQRVLECAVRIMTVGALHQPFRHFVMKRLREGDFRISVAALTETRFSDLK